MYSSKGTRNSFLVSTVLSKIVSQPGVQELDFRAAEELALFRAMAACM